MAAVVALFLIVWLWMALRTYKSFDVKSSVEQKEMCIRDRVYDEIIPVSNEASFEYGKIIAKEEGVLVAVSYTHLQEQLSMQQSR